MKRMGTDQISDHPSSSVAYSPMRSLEEHKKHKTSRVFFVPFVALLLCFLCSPLPCLTSLAYSLLETQHYVFAAKQSVLSLTHLLPTRARAPKR